MIFQTHYKADPKVVNCNVKTRYDFNKIQKQFAFLKDIETNSGHIAGYWGSNYWPMYAAMTSQISLFFHICLP